MRDIKKIISENLVLKGKVKRLKEKNKKLINDIKRGGKRCATCGEFKPYSEFNKNNAANDGFTYSCKDCIKSQYKKKK